VIKINVTDEMVQVAQLGEVCCSLHSGRVVRAILDIVERDLNAVSAEDDDTGHVVLIPNGCIEVTE
jgi:hypothetical protein